MYIPILLLSLHLFAHPLRGLLGVLVSQIPIEALTDQHSAAPVDNAQSVVQSQTPAPAAATQSVSGAVSQPPTQQPQAQPSPNPSQPLVSIPPTVTSPFAPAPIVPSARSNLVAPNDRVETPATLSDTTPSSRPSGSTSSTASTSTGTSGSVANQATGTSDTISIEPSATVSPSKGVSRSPQSSIVVAVSVGAALLLLSAVGVFYMRHKRNLESRRLLAKSKYEDMLTASAVVPTIEAYKTLDPSSDDSEGLLVVE